MTTLQNPGGLRAREQVPGLTRAALHLLLDLADPRARLGARCEGEAEMSEKCEGLRKSDSTAPGAEKKTKNYLKRSKLHEERSHVFEHVAALPLLSWSA